MKKIIILILFLFVSLMAFSQSSISFYAENTYGCAPLVVQFTNNSYIDGSVQGPVTYYWYINGEMVSNSDTTFADTLDVGHYNVSLSAIDDMGNNIGDYYDNFQISGNPKLFWTSTGDTVCPGEDIKFDFDWFDESEYLARWDFGDGGTANGNWVNHMYPDEGTYNVVLILETYCGTDTIEKLITVNTNAIPDVRLHTNGGDVFCPDDLIQFETSGQYKSYKWMFGDGGEDSYNPRPIRKFQEVGNYNVILEAENICGNISVDSMLIRIEDNVPVYADFHKWPESICPGQTITFEPHSSGEHTWIFNNGIPRLEPRPMVFFPDTGDVHVVHIVENGCGSMDTVEQFFRIDYTYETVYENIDFSIENERDDGYMDSIYVCPGEELVFRNNSNINDLKFEWIFSDQDTIRQINAKKKFDLPGVYTMFLKAKNSCGGEGYSRMLVIVVDPGIKPKAAMSAVPRYICPGEVVYFYDEEFNDFYSSNTYDIIFGDGAEANNLDSITDPEFHTFAQHTYDSEGEYVFYFMAKNSCGNVDTVSGVISVSEDDTRKPNYYISNSTESPFEGEIKDWSMSKEAEFEHTFVVPLRWVTWTPGMNDKFIVYFWYGDVDLMNSEDPGKPDGMVMMASDQIVTGDTVTAFVPYDIEPMVTLAAVWYCDSMFNFDREPDNFSLPVDAMFNPIAGIDIIPGGSTTLENVMDFPEFTGMCGSKKLDGRYVAQLPDGKRMFLDFWEDEQQQMQRFDLQSGDERHSSSNNYISSGYFNYTGTDSVELTTENGNCYGFGTYHYMINGDTLFLMGTDECADRETALVTNVFLRERYDDYYDMSTCPGDLVKFSIAGGTDYEWHFGDGDTDIGQIVYHAYQDTGFFNAFAIVTNGCNRVDTVFTPVRIGLHNTPDAYFNLSDYFIETDETVHFQIQRWDDFDPNKYIWDFGDGTSSTMREPGHIYKFGGEYNVKLEVKNGCGSSFTEQKIYVNGPANNCDLKADFNFEVIGDTVRFFEASSGVLPTRFVWNFGNETGSEKPNPVRVFPNAGIYNVCLTVVDSISGCTDDICKEFVIGNIECYANFEPKIDPDNNSVLFLDKSSNATEWFWSFGDGEFSSMQNPEHQYEKSGFYDVNLSIYSESTNCSNEFKQRIFVGYLDSVDCYVNFSYDVEDFTVSFIADVSSNITGGYWQFGDGYVAHDKEVAHTYAKPGEYKVCATVFDTINDCQKTICKTIFVGEVDCQAGFTFIVNDDNSVDFYDESKGMNLEYSWDFGDGYFSSEMDPVHTFAPGVYTVCLSVNDAVLDCYDDYCINIVIKGGEDDKVICTPEMSYFIENGTFNVSFSEATGQPYTEYYWDFGDGTFSNLKSPKHAFAKEGIYEVCLQVYNENTGCGDGVCEKVIIQSSSTTIATVNANFGYFVNQLTNIVTFTDKSTGNVTSRYWTFGDGKVASDSARIKHHYAVPKTYEACLIVVDEDNGLKSKVCRSVIVGTKDCNLEADFNFVINPDDNLIKFVDNSKGNVNRWSWNFDDGTTSQRANPFHIYNEPGYYLVKLGVRDTISGCNDVHFELIQAGSVDCKALFDYEVDPDSLKVEFTNSSRGNIADFYWYFGDHTSSNDENPVKYYKKPGLYKVALAVNNSTGDCADYVVIPVQVGEVTCEADFEVFVDSVNNVAFFENTSIGNIERFNWFFGDGYQSTRENPIHFYPRAGYYTVHLVTASGDCMSKTEETILIGAQGMDCEANFFANIDENSQSVKFVDKSLGENLEYIWNFGDGNASSLESPEHTYESGGYYNVCLTVINGDGVSNTTCKFIQVSTEDYNSCFADFIYTADSITKTVEFIDLSAGDPNRWIWHFGDGNSSNEQNPTHTYDEAGYYRVKLVSGDTTSGCASLTFGLVNVAEEATGLVAGFGYQIDSLTLKGTGKPVDFVGVSVSKTSNFSWDFGDGNKDSTTLTPTNVYAASGTYNVCFTVSDPITGMSNTFCDNVVIQLGTDIDYMFDNNYSLAVYPNPFEDEMRVRYRIEQPTDVDIEVYDELGRLIDVIVHDYKYEGEYEVVWNNNSISNGIYNLRMRTNTGIIKNLRIIKN